MMSELRKNNVELAKTLNTYKQVVARLEKEKNSSEASLMEMRMELATLRASALPDPQEVEAEVARLI